MYLIRKPLVRKSNCLKPLKLILLSNLCEKIVAKTKNLGIVIMNKMRFGTIYIFNLIEMGNEHPSFFTTNSDIFKQYK